MEEEPSFFAWIPEENMIPEDQLRKPERNRRSNRKSKNPFDFFSLRDWGDYLDRYSTYLNCAPSPRSGSNNEDGERCTSPAPTSRDVNNDNTSTSSSSSPFMRKNNFYREERYNNLNRKTRSVFQNGTAVVVVEHSKLERKRTASSCYGRHCPATGARRSCYGSDTSCLGADYVSSSEDEDEEEEQSPFMLRSNKNRSASESFREMLPENVREMNVAEACANLLSVLPLGGAALAAGPPGVAMMMCPNPIAFAGNVSPAIAETFEGIFPENWTLVGYQRGILLVTFVQGSMGILRMCMGDVFSGAYALLLATLGYNARFPGPAMNWLKTYILITFINGTVGTVDFIQQMLLQNYPILSPALPFAVNAAHLISVSIPTISFLGAYIGWQYIKSQKIMMEQMKAQQNCPPQLNPNLPWPPPALPPPHVLAHMQQEIDKHLLQHRQLMEMEEQLVKKEEELGLTPEEREEMMKNAQKSGKQATPELGRNPNVVDSDDESGDEESEGEESDEDEEASEEDSEVEESDLEDLDGEEKWERITRKKREVEENMAKTVTKKEKEPLPQVARAA